MVYVGSDGRVYDQKPWTLSRIRSMFWGFLMFFWFYFNSLIQPFLNMGSSYTSDSRRGGSNGRSGGGGGGGGGYGSGGGGGGGRGGPSWPNKRIGRINHSSSVNVPGGCAGGSCGR